MMAYSGNDNSAKDVGTSGAVGNIMGSVTGGLLSLPFQMYAGAQNRKYLNKAMGDINTGYDQAGGYSQAGQNYIQGQYSPFTQGAQQTYNATGDYLNNMTQPGMAQQSNFNANSANPYLNRMSNYQADQSNKAIQSSALARGGVGGGLAQDLANNAAKYATQNFNDANRMAMEAGNANFNQANTNYSNQAAWKQNMFNNLLGYGNQGIGQMNVGNQMWNQYQGNQISNAVGRGQDLASINAAKAGSQSGLFNSIGNTMGQIGASTAPLWTYGIG